MKINNDAEVHKTDKIVVTHSSSYKMTIQQYFGFK